MQQQFSLDLVYYPLFFFDASLSYSTFKLPIPKKKRHTVFKKHQNYFLFIDNPYFWLKKMGRILILFMIAMMAISFMGRKDKIKESVLTELKNYPQARLADIYKNFFQDAFGPGHLIPDTTQAGAYLSYELQDTLWGDTVKWQVLGGSQSFYRINLSLVKDGRIPRSVLLEGMVKSVPLARNPDLAEWKEEWSQILEVIKEMNLKLPDFDPDKKAIDEKLVKGEIVAHHSDLFTETYHPHYRIVHYTIFEKWRKEFLKGLSTNLPKSTSLRSNHTCLFFRRFYNKNRG